MTSMFNWENLEIIYHNSVGWRWTSQFWENQRTVTHIKGSQLLYRSHYFWGHSRCFKRASVNYTRGFAAVLCIPFSRDFRSALLRKAVWCTCPRSIPVAHSTGGTAVPELPILAAAPHIHRTPGRTIHHISPQALLEINAWNPWNSAWPASGGATAAPKVKSQLLFGKILSATE